MKVPNVKILAYCANPELWRAMTLVFDSLRTGFPTAQVQVFINCVPSNAEGALLTKAVQDARVDQIGWEPREGEGVFTPTTTHWQWILDLLDRETEPFYICDTDIVFWSSVEGWDFGDAAMAGRYIPQFKDSFTNCVTRPRLHTSLLYLNPVEIKKRVTAYLAQFPETDLNPRPNLIFPCQFPFRQGRRVTNYFYDTACMLYQAIAGQHFTEAQLEAYDHIMFATASDIVCDKPPRNRWRGNHLAVFENPSLLKGAWRLQEKFFQENAV